MKNYLIKIATLVLNRYSTYLLKFSDYLDSLKKDRYKKAREDNKKYMVSQATERANHELEWAKKVSLERQEEYLKTGIRYKNTDPIPDDILALMRNK